MTQAFGTRPTLKRIRTTQLPKRIIENPGGRLVTTDYIFDEVLTLLSARGHRALTKPLAPKLLAGEICQFQWTNRADIEAAWLVFDRFQDKQWSFTDCVSYAVMKRLDIKEAFAIDEHFVQFGFVEVRP